MKFIKFCCSFLIVFYFVLSNSVIRGQDTTEYYFDDSLTITVEIDENWLECYEHWLVYCEHSADLQVFVECLREKALTHWNKVVKISLTFPGGFPREIDQRPPYPVTNLDRTRVLALLDAWTAPFGDLEPEYIDLEEFIKFRELYDWKEYAGKGKLYRPDQDDPLGSDPFYVDYENAKRIIGVAGLMSGGGEVYIPKSSPVKYLNEELTKLNKIIFNNFAEFSKDQPLIEHPHFNLNSYFSMLLEWDYEHCYGLLIKLYKEYCAISQGSGDLSPMLQAALDWVNYCQDENPGLWVYSRYPYYKRAEKDLDHKKYKD